MHAASLSYPQVPTDADRDSMYRFLYAISGVLPCPKCRVDFKNYLREHLPTRDADALASRDQCVEFVIHAHNHVNAKLGKPTLEMHKALRLITETPCRGNL